ncbi:MAG: hypothetical protein ACRENP_06575 [Longimicrobiales bacterium]
MRLSCSARASLLTLCVSVPFTPVHAQGRSSNQPPEEGDTIPSARIVVLPALERYNMSRLGRDVKNMPALAVFTTDGPVARSLAVKVQSIVGGPIIQLGRANRSIEDFTHALIDTIVEKTARPNMNRGHRSSENHAAIVLVAEPELILPFVRGSLSERGQAEFDRRKVGLATFTVFVRADKKDLISARPLPPL